MLLITMTERGLPHRLYLWESGAVHKWFIVQGFYVAWQKNQTSIDTCVCQGTRLVSRFYEGDSRSDNGGRFARIIYLDSVV